MEIISQVPVYMMTSSNGNIFCVTDHLCWSPVKSPHTGQWCGALMFSLICAWMGGWVNNREAGDLRRHGAHYVVTVMNTNSTLVQIMVWHSKGRQAIVWTNDGRAQIKMWLTWWHKRKYKTHYEMNRVIALEKGFLVYRIKNGDNNSTSVRITPSDSFSNKNLLNKHLSI